jgi:hypothetical protein
LGSLVFSRSKDGGAGDGPLPESIYKPKLLSNADLIIQLKIKA